jgi:hypothetical protein
MRLRETPDLVTRAVPAAVVHEQDLGPHSVKLEDRCQPPHQLPNVPLFVETRNDQRELGAFLAIDRQTLSPLYDAMLLQADILTPRTRRGRTSAAAEFP